MEVRQLLESKNFLFKESGKDYMIRCLNPDHEDNNPSMRVDKVTGVFNCFSCGHSGNLFELFNIHRSVINLQIQQLKNKIKNLMDYNLNLPLGHNPFNKDFRGISKETFQEFSAFTHSDYEDKVVFPITDIHDNIKAFISRDLYSNIEPRYLVHPKEVPLFPYPTKPEIINNSIILVEGIFDMLNCWDKGLRNVVCLFGTGVASSKNKNKIAKFVASLQNYHLQGVTMFYLMFDGDEAGQQAAENTQKILSKSYYSEIIEMEEGTDPGDLTLKQIQQLKKSLYS